MPEDRTQPNPYLRPGEPDELAELFMPMRGEMEKRLDRYGMALMMIAEGCGDPTGVAKRALEKAQT